VFEGEYDITTCWPEPHQQFMENEVRMDLDIARDSHIRRRAKPQRGALEAHTKKAWVA
jgi:hypothetical protein